MYILSNTKDMFMKYTFYHLKEKGFFFNRYISWGACIEVFNGRAI